MREREREICSQKAGLGQRICILYRELWSLLCPIKARGSLVSQLPYCEVFALELSKNKASCKDDWMICRDVEISWALFLWPFTYHLHPRLCLFIVRLWGSALYKPPGFWENAIFQSSVRTLSHVCFPFYPSLWDPPSWEQSFGNLHWCTWALHIVTHPRSHTLPGINFSLYNGFKEVYTESGWHHVTPLTAFPGPLSSWSPQTVGGSWSDFPVQQDSPYGRTF